MIQLLDAFQLVPCSNSPPFFWRNCYELGTFVSAHRKEFIRQQKKKAEAVRLTLTQEGIFEKFLEAWKEKIARSSVHLVKNSNKRGTAAKEKRLASDKAEIKQNSTR